MNGVGTVKSGKESERRTRKRLDIVFPVFSVLILVLGLVKKVITDPPLGRSVRVKAGLCCYV